MPDETETAVAKATPKQPPPMPENATYPDAPVNMDDRIIQAVASNMHGAQAAPLRSFSGAQGRAASFLAHEVLGSLEAGKLAY